MYSPDGKPKHCRGNGAESEKRCETRTRPWHCTKEKGTPREKRVVIE